MRNQNDPSWPYLIERLQALDCPPRGFISIMCSNNLLYRIKDSKFFLTIESQILKNTDGWLMSDVISIVSILEHFPNFSE
jgi:hypothetical protein